MTDPKTYLSTRDLQIGYVQKGQENRLFSNLNLSLQGGKMICFMGPNGAGKSSLLRTLAGLQKPLRGEVIVGNAGGRKERQIAVVLTDRVTAVNLTVAEIVTFGRYPYLGWNIRLTEEDRRIVNRSIEQVHIQPLLHKRLYELSDGQMQMVMIARALAQDTPVILLDEPTAHLDLNNRVEIMNMLRQLSRTTGKAILLATHELDLALQTADLIWLTGKNRDILTGWPEDLVLNGSFDDTFEFKGFDLKSGKVLQNAHRNISVQLAGEGPAFLWTKNALERNGYDVTSAPREISVSILQDSSGVKWKLSKGNISELADSIEKLMKLL